MAASTYAGVAEVCEVSAAQANHLLSSGKGWKVLDIKTITFRVFREVVTRSVGWTNKYEPVYDETSQIVYILGRREQS